MRVPAHLKLALPLLAGIVISIALLVLSELSHRRLSTANQDIATSAQIQAVASEVLALVVDAETAQRGFLVTGQRTDLDPYWIALPKIAPKLKALDDLVQRLPEQHARVQLLHQLIGSKLTALDASLALARTRGPNAAREEMTLRGSRVTMQHIRELVDAISSSERASLVGLSYRWNQDLANSRFGLAIATMLNLILLIVVYTLTSREFTRKERMRLRLVQQKHLLEAQVLNRTAELSELSSDLQRVQESEKSRLARELHDEMGSILVSAKMDISWALNRIRASSPEAVEKLARALQTLDDGVEVKRRIVEDLRPALLDNLGLGAAITWHAEQISERSGLPIEVLVPEEDVALPSNIAIALFRVMQEAMTNVVRHASAHRASIELQCEPEEVRMEVRDDGAGLSAQGAKRAQRSLGLMSMRQRIVGVGGDFEISSAAGRGTLLRVRVPLPPVQTPSSEGAAKPEGALHR